MTKGSSYSIFMGMIFFQKKPIMEIYLPFRHFCKNKCLFIQLYQ